MTLPQNHAAFYIGALPINSRALQAPMLAFTDHISRTLAYRYGCGIAFSEMIHAEALLRGDIEYERYFRRCGANVPIAVQIAGKETRAITEAVRVAFNHGADIVDINMGCSKANTVKSGAGAALLMDFSKAKSVITAALKIAPGPVTLKMRAGWNPQTLIAPKLAQFAADAGIAAITIHPRFAIDNYGVRADWSLIARIVEIVSVPVIGNGDITCAADAQRMIDTTGCAAVLVGRSAIGNPWIFQQINEALKGNKNPMEPSSDERFSVIYEHLNELIAWVGETEGIRRFRTHINGYVRGLVGNNQLKQTLATIRSLTILMQELERFRTSVNQLKQ